MRQMKESMIEIQEIIEQMDMNIEEQFIRSWLLFRYNEFFTRSTHISSAMVISSYKAIQGYSFDYNATLYQLIKLMVFQKKKSYLPNRFFTHEITSLFKLNNQSETLQLQKNLATLFTNYSYKRFNISIKQEIRRGYQKDNCYINYSENRFIQVKSIYLDNVKISQPKKSQYDLFTTGNFVGSTWSILPINVA